MFGLFRFYLAVAVVAFHLLRLPEIGAAAVFAFFTLSGFLMTNIMQKTYGYSGRGFIAYLSNRALRLFPSYWIAILLSFIVITITGAAFAGRFNRALDIPSNPTSWFMNLTMIFPSLYPNQIKPRLFPLVWTLTVEFFHYILIGLGMTRAKMLTIACAIAALAYDVYGLTTQQSFEYHYHALFGGSLPFAAGALAYHYREPLGRHLGRHATLMLGLHAATLFACAAVFYVMVFILRQEPTGYLVGMVDLATLGLTVCVTAPTIAALYSARAYVVDRRLDTLLGKYSYPYYLLHMQAWVLVSYVGFGRRVAGANIAGVIVFILSILLVTAIGWAIIRFVEPAVDRLRDRVKGKRKAGQETASKGGAAVSA